MVALRSGPKGVGMASFGLTAFMLIAIPFNGGDPELGVVSAHASALERARPSLIASPFGTIHAATLSFPRPLGTTMPEPPSVRLASIDSKTVIGNVDAQAAAPVIFPTVDRSRKGDFLAALPPPETVIETIEPAEHVAQPSIDDEIEAAARFVPFPEYDISMSLELYPRIPGDETGEIPEITAEAPDISLLAAVNDPDPTTRTSRLFFGEMGSSSLANIVPWNPGEEPILAQRAPDAEIKRSALAALSDPTATGPDAGESVSSKGEFNIPPPANSPAARLSLIGTTREKAESCLTKAVYFESRGESLRGQIAVAQVVLNRTFSGYYPSDVCDVVYQNAHRHNSCQFSFACDRLADTVTEPEAWDRATRVAKATLDGKVWLPEIGKATHYHAYWVKPWWVRTMRKFTRIGVHSC